MKKLSGVIDAKTDRRIKEITVTYNPDEIDVAEILKVIDAQNEKMKSEGEAPPGPNPLSVM